MTTFAPGNSSASRARQAPGRELARVGRCDAATTTTSASLRRDDGLRRPGGHEVLDALPDPLPQRLGVGGPGRRQLERDRRHVVRAGRVVAEVRGPAGRVGGVPAAAEQQPLDQVVADPAGGGGHHPLAAEDDAADRGGVLGDQQRHVLAERLLRRVEGDQVRRHLVADQDRRDDDGGHPADVRQPQRPLGQPGGAQHLAEPRVDHVVPHQRGRLLRRQPGRGRGLHVHQLADDRDGGRGPLGDELHHAGQVGVLHGEAGQVPVHGDQLAQDSVLPVDVRAGASAWSVRSPGSPVTSRVRHVPNHTPAGRARPCGDPQTHASMAC